MIWSRYEAFLAKIDKPADGGTCDRLAYDD